MDEVCQGLHGVFCYIDDILVASRSKEEHRRHLMALFQRLQEYGLVINVDKCKNCGIRNRNLGHRISPARISPLPSSVQTIISFERPNSIKKLQHWLGMCNYYRHFIKNAATLFFPLHASLAGNPKTLEWTAEMEAAFTRIKKVMADLSKLSHADFGLPFAFFADASSIAIGTVPRWTRRVDTNPILQ